MKLFKIFLLLLFSCLPVFGQKQKSDRQIDGFKGTVKRAITERSDIKLVKGKDVESKRLLEHDLEYNAAGNRSREKAYDYMSGLLREIMVYKLVDGDKAVVYEDGDTPGKIVGDLPVTTIDGSPIKVTEGTFDPRYTYKFKYKFDPDGNVLEEAWWQSEETLWLRYVYTLKGNQKEELVFAADGSMNQKCLHIFDARGNEIEEHIYDTKNNSLLEKLTYEYLAFDSAGNWVKRRTTAGNKQTNFVQKPREVMYRKITYYLSPRRQPK
jgi:hypothetical protein